MGGGSTRTIALDHPVVFALAPALGYLIAYLDRLGEALAYGIPRDYIFLSITDALSRTSMVVLFATTLLLTARLQGWLVSRMPRWAARAIDTGMTWLLLAAFVWILGSSLRVARWVIAVGAFYTIVDAIWGFFHRRRHHEATPARADSGGPVVLGEPQQTSTQVGLPIGLTVVIVVVMLGAAFVGGNLRASTATRYLVASDAPDSVLLALYGDGRAVLGRLEPGGTLLAERRFIHPSDGLGAYDWADIGVITAPDGVSLLPLVRLQGLAQ